MAVNRFVGDLLRALRQSPAGCEYDLHTGPAVAVAVYLCRLPYRARQHVEDFEGMLEAAGGGMPREVCVCLQRNTDRCIPVLMEYVLKEKAAR